MVLNELRIGELTKKKGLVLQQGVHSFLEQPETIKKLHALGVPVQIVYQRLGDVVVIPAG